MIHSSRLRWLSLALYASTLGLLTFGHGWAVSMAGSHAGGHATAHDASPASVSERFLADESGPPRRGDDSHDSRSCLVCQYLSQFHATLSLPPPAAGGPAQCGLLPLLDVQPISRAVLSLRARAPPSVG